jgi:hypothetical protein
MKKKQKERQEPPPPRRAGGGALQGMKRVREDGEDDGREKKKAKGVV